MRLQQVTPPVFSMTGTTANTVAQVTALAPIGLPPFAIEVFQPFVGQPVTGAGIPTGATVLSVDSPTQVTLSQPATASGTVAIQVGTDPVALADVLTHIRFQVSPSDPAYAQEIVLVTRLVRTAVRNVQTILKQVLITQTWQMYLDAFPVAGGYYNPEMRQQWRMMGGVIGTIGFFPGMIPNSSGVIDIPLTPLQKVNSVQYYDFNGVLQTVDSATYNTSLGVYARIQPQYSKVWPISRPTIDSVMINFTCGYGPLASNITETVQSAILMCVGSWYINREHLAPGGNSEMLIVPDTVSRMLMADDPGVYV